MTPLFIRNAGHRSHRILSQPSSSLKRSIAKRPRGSAILLAVALLVLLAIMGVAFISSARSERLVSAVGTHAVQGDLLVRGALGLVESTLVNDIIVNQDGKPVLRPASGDDEEEAPSYRHWDAATGEGADEFLAERIPMRGEDGAIVWPAISGPLSTADSFEDPTRPYGTHTFNDRTDVAPTSIQYAGKSWPALQVGTGPEAQRYLAADTDADGIADAALFPLDVQNGGVTYYAAMRIVDNNSGLNASLAWRPQDEPDPQGHGPSFFPTHIDLESVLAPGEVDRLQGYRFAALKNAEYKKLDPTQAWLGFARLVHGASAGPFRMLPASDALALAQDPLGLMSAGGGPFLESLIPVTTRTRPRNRYAAGDVDRWYEENYNFAAAAVSCRPLLVAANPMSHVIPTRQVPARLAELFGIPAAVSAAPTNVNSASFELLWQAYWNMMSGHGEATPFELAAEAEEERTGVPVVAAERMFRSPLRTGKAASDSGKPPVVAAASTGGQRIAPFEVLLLRAALAAVNTIDLRDDDDDVTSKRITLKRIENGSEQNVSITVFGNERQPFITEVYVHTNTQDPGGPNRQRNLRGYVAVELHNPFNEELSLAGWRLGILERGRSQTSRVSLLPVSDMTGFDESVIIPANGYLIVENYASDGSGTAAYRPFSSGLPATRRVDLPNVRTVCVKNLHEVIADGGNSGGELVLLRPCSIDGSTVSAGSDQTAATGSAETAQLEDLAPIDQFDFTGMELQDPGEKAYDIWQYNRVSGIGERAWKFVYPGRYDGAKAEARQEGTDRQTMLDFDGEPNVILATLGRADAEPSYANPFQGIPLAQQPSPTDAYPHGQFARVADALAVPFIGAYRVSDGDAVLEMNAITMDAALADDQDEQTDQYEHIGRFIPIPAIGVAEPARGPRTPRPRIHWRPKRSAGHGAEVRYENFLIEDIIDKDAVQIQGYDDRKKSGNWYAPGHVILRNFEVGHTERSPAGRARKLHVDHIQITLGQEHQEIKTDVTIEDGYIHSGNADTLLIQDGKYGTIYIRNLKVGPGLPSVKITIAKGGSIDRVVIEDCPGLSVAVTGVKGMEAQGGNIGYVEVINSPGAKIKRQKNWETGVSLKLDIRYTNDGTARGLGVDDYSDNPALWRYGWATDFFDHFTTLPTAADQYDVDGELKEQQELAKSAPIEGLININTAPWPVLAALPLVDGTSGEEDAEKLAHAIVAGRANNPYRTIQDLSRIESGFQEQLGFLEDPMPSMDVDVDDPVAVRRAMEALREWKMRHGDLSPDDGIVGEQGRRGLLLDRISNLITTRSDSFTCYLTIQGWRNATHQGGQPELVLERRDLYILDRSTVTPENPKLKIMSSRMH